MDTGASKKPYLKQVTEFYFAPIWQSFFTILYLVFFFYFAVFHSGKLFLAAKFIIYTLKNSASLAGLDNLFFGVAFLTSLIIPFSVSVYAIFLLFEIWGLSTWSAWRKVLMTFAVIVIVPSIIVLMDEIIRAVGGRSELAEFVALNLLNL